MHVTKRAAAFAIAAASLLAISLPFAMTATAQTTPDPVTRPAQGGGAAAGPGSVRQGQDRFGGQNPGAPRPEGIAQPGQFRPGGGMGGAVGIAMESDNNFLYLVQGHMVFKINKADLRIVAQTSLIQIQTFSGPSTPIQPDRRTIPPSGGGGGGKAK